MKRLVALGAFLIQVFLADPGFAFMHRGSSSAVATLAPANTAIPQVIGLDYPNNGTTTALSGTATTLTANVGTWDNCASCTYSYNWHTVNAPLTSLGTGPTLTIDTSTTPALVGQAIELEIRAVNGVGSVTQRSHWFGPIATSVPAAPISAPWCTAVLSTDGLNHTAEGEYCPIQTIDGTAPLPAPLVHYLQNGEAVFPGCAIPPASPNTAAGHLWYFDPVGGSTETAGATGVDKAHAYRDITALFNTTPGYSGKLWNRVVHPGDTIYLEPGWGGSNPAGVISSTVANAAYSTSDGTSTGTVLFTEILPDPTAVSQPTLSNITFQNGGAGFLFKGLKVELNRATAISVTGGITVPAHDFIFDNMRISQWLGHSNDPWPSSYPMADGHSDGTDLTATPTFTGANEDPGYVAVTGGLNATVLTPTGNAMPIMGLYLWPKNIYYNGAIAAPATGIPPGTMVKQISGLNSTQYVFVGQVNAMSVSELLTATSNSGLTLQAGSPFANITALNAVTGDGTTYAIVAASNTAVQTLYKWTGSAWASFGNTLPVAPTLANTVYETINNTSPPIVTISGNPRVAHWNGATWDNQGALNMTIGPCDPVADAATGCPTTDFPGLSHSATSNIPGCDPITTLFGTTVPSGGCPGGTPVAWNGLTRAMSNESLLYTQAITIVPANAWNYVDWEAGLSYGVHFAGQLYIALSPDSTHPNVFQGFTCGSFKDSIIREEAVGVSFSNTTNTLFYNNKLKYISQDMFQPYSDNRPAMIHNFASDPTQIQSHQDAIQFADSNGRGNAGGCGTGAQCTDMLFGGWAEENEFVQRLDPTNYFQREFQGINDTEHNHWGQFVATNIVIATTNGIGLNGPYNVIIHNDMFGKGINDGWQPKGNPNFITSPLYGLLANNAANGVSRQAQTLFMANYCSTDHQTLETNTVVPFITSVGVAGAPSSIYCTNDGTPGSGVVMGLSQGLVVWSSDMDWRSGVTGVSPLFHDYHPVNGPVNPAVGWAGQPLEPFNLCAQNSFLPTTGTCPPGTAGIVNFRPSASFSGFNGHVAVSLTPGNTTGEAFYLPTTASLPGLMVGDYGTVPTGTASGVVYPAGLWRYCVYTTGLSVNCAADPAFPFAHGWTFSSASGFNPAILGAGTNLGAEQPIADMAGNPWGATPSVGAYQQ